MQLLVDVFCWVMKIGILFFADPSSSCRLGQNRPLRLSAPPLVKGRTSLSHVFRLWGPLLTGRRGGRRPGWFYVHFLCLSKVNEPKERTPNARNFSAFDGKLIPKLRVEQVLLSFGAFVIYFALWGLWNLRFHYRFPGQ
jgi:hypothetical protein